MNGSLSKLKQAQKYAKKLAASGLKPKAQKLLEIIKQNPSFSEFIPSRKKICPPIW